MITSPTAYVLAAPLFDELGVVTCLSELRAQGVKAFLVSTTSGLLSGKRGITLRPDKILSQINEMNFCSGQMAIISGGEESAAASLTDPRTHELLRNILASDGYVAGMRHTYQFIESSGFATTQEGSRFFWQEGEETAVFVQSLINILLQM